MIIVIYSKKLFSSDWPLCAVCVIIKKFYSRPDIYLICLSIFPFSCRLMFLTVPLYVQYLKDPFKRENFGNALIMYLC